MFIHIFYIFILQIKKKITRIYCKKHPTIFKVVSRDNNFSNVVYLSFFLSRASFIRIKKIRGRIDVYWIIYSILGCKYRLYIPKYSVVFYICISIFLNTILWDIYFKISQRDFILLSGQALEIYGFIHFHLRVAREISRSEVLVSI